MEAQAQAPIQISFMRDIRYSEFLYLQALQKRSFDYFNALEARQTDLIGLDPGTYTEMVAVLLEELMVQFENDSIQLIVWRLRRDHVPDRYRTMDVNEIEWTHPRQGLLDILRKNILQRIRVTYRGLRRLEELRDLLKRDRILEPFGVLLDIRYFPPDLTESLNRSPDIAVSVLKLDMDNFKRVNDQFGHAAGDVVMKSYLESVRDGLGSLGHAYRGRGDEVVALIVGQSHERTCQIAETIRQGVERMKCQFEKTDLPQVTASIGVASNPPELRLVEMENLADERQMRAKKLGNNQVVFD